MSRYGVVEYFGEDEDGGHSCGYCKGKTTSYTHGMWGHALFNRDYQDLIDRGWRRSGKYLYKPVMHRTCCPQYTIRCDVGEFRPTRSHKKVIKKFRHFVIHGNKKGEGEKEAEGGDGKERDQEDGDGKIGRSEADLVEERMAAVGARVRMDGKEELVPAPSSSKIAKDPKDGRKANEKSLESEAGATASKASPSPAKEVRQGAGADPDRPKARKAKDIRKEKALLKKLARGEDDKEGSPAKKEKKNNCGGGGGGGAKTLADFLDEPFPADAKHKFEVRTVWAQTKDKDFAKSYAETLSVYQKYQTRIHGDKLSKVSSDQFKRFLCDAPLFLEERGDFDANSSSSHSAADGALMGGFHQQYLLDGKIIFVGVVDVLPNCLSSVYLFYDPDFAFLSPGTLSSLFELHFSRRVALPYYYMGFYIHDCPKMRYKAQYLGSYLLCPEKYDWVPVGDCIPLLDASKYSRLKRNEEEGRGDAEVDPSHTMILYHGTAMPYSVYSQMRRPSSGDDDDEVREYRSLVGSGPASRMLLYRS